MDSIATFLRMEDGGLQIPALNSHLRGRHCDFYEVWEYSVRPLPLSSPQGGAVLTGRQLGAHLSFPGPAVSSISQIAPDVLVFINRPLEKVNHMFFDALADQARRADSGLVTGITVDLAGKITHSGFEIAADGSYSDKFAGVLFSDFIRMAESRSVRCVDTISNEFFAIGKQHLAAVGGISAVSSSRMPGLAKRLIRNALNGGLRVFVTPFAVATVETFGTMSQRHVEAGGTYRQVAVAPDFEPPLDCSSQVTEDKCEPALARNEGEGDPIVVGGFQANAHYPVWKHVIPLPPNGMMRNVGAPSIENFLVVADAWTQLISHYTPKNANVMDIGCGCGRIARGLVNNPWIRKYVGFDVMHDHVDWCRTFIQPVWLPVAEFHWFDLHSEAYHPNGVLKARDLAFPAENGTVDVIFAASVFTHLFETDARHYLQEIARVLAPRGVALLSIHEDVEPGQRFSGTEGRIDIDPSYFIEMAGDSGLLEIECLDFCGQRLFVLRSDEMARAGNA